MTRPPGPCDVVAMWVNEVAKAHAATRSDVRFQLLDWHWSDRHRGEDAARSIVRALGGWIGGGGIGVGRYAWH